MKINPFEIEIFLQVVELIWDKRLENSPTLINKKKIQNPTEILIIKKEIKKHTNENENTTIELEIKDINPLIWLKKKNLLIFPTKPNKDPLKEIEIIEKSWSPPQKNQEKTKPDSPQKENNKRWKIFEKFIEKIKYTPKQNS